MKLLGSETLLEELPGVITLRRSYLPAKHTYDFTFLQTSLFCPKCGERDVWDEDSAGDYYVGSEHRCGSCGYEFYLP